MQNSKSNGQGIDFNPNILVGPGNPFAEELCRQEGLPFRVLSLEDALKMKPGIYIPKDPLGAPEAARLPDYVRSGGVVLCDKTVFAALPSGMKIPAEGFPDGMPAAASLDFRFRDYANVFSYAPRRFITPRYCVQEKVASKPGSFPLENFRNAIKKIFFEKNLPYIHKWYYPGSLGSIACLKVDLDNYVASDIQNLMEDTRGISHAVTWFVCCSEVERGESLVTKELLHQGFDVQSHGYYHHVYHTAEENRVNLARSVDFLNRQGVRVKGFSGPMGKWNRPLCDVLQSLGFSYSSDFGYDYDNFPSMVCAAQCTDLLQIPVHPLCLGSFIEAGCRDRALEHFSAVIRMKRRNKEPIMIYGHPDGRLGKYRDFTRAIVSELQSMTGVKLMSMTQIDQWWRQRRAQKFEVSSAHSDRIVLAEGTAADPDTGYRVELRDGREGFWNEPGQTVPLKALPLSPVCREEKFYAEQPVRTGMKEKFKEWLDWEDVTPEGAMKHPGFRGSLKSALRKWRKQHASG